MKSKNHEELLLDFLNPLTARGDLDYMIVNKTANGRGKDIVITAPLLGEDNELFDENCTIVISFKDGLVRYISRVSAKEDRDAINKKKERDKILVEISGELTDKLNLEFLMYGEVKAETAKEYVDHMYAQTLKGLNNKLDQQITKPYVYKRKVENENK